MPENELRTILLEALEIERPEERAAYLPRVCGADAALRREVEELIQAQEAAGRFLPDEPAGATVAGSAGAAPMSVAEQPGDRIGRYKLLQKIGEGGWGVVYMAEQEEPVRRRVALKVIKLGMDTRRVVARFEAERQALALMDHPNIAKVFDAGATGAAGIGDRGSEIGDRRLGFEGRSAGEARGVNSVADPKSAIRDAKSEVPSGRPYFVMELVRGVKITEYCEREKLSTRDRLDLFIEVCQAIQHAHQKGIIHRDIKPSNILVTLHDGQPVPKVIDFGIAKATEGRLTDRTVFTAFDQFIGTPAYMSPEQAELSGLDIDTRSDIYSLGVLLYELLTGTTPFDVKELMSQGLEAMRRTIREKEPPRPSTRLTQLRQQGQSQSPIPNSQGRAGKGKSEIRNPKSEIESDLDWIVMKCLEKDRNRRYETANGLATDLQRHLDHEPVIARPPSAAYRLQKAWRRNRLAYTAGLAVVLALVVGLTLATLGWSHALTQQRQANVAREATRQRAYAAEISAAFHALAENNLDRALNLLNRQRPKPGEQHLEDLRGFEWRLLWQLCQTDSEILPGVADGAVAFSPDGKWLAQAGTDPGANIVIRALPLLTVVHTIPSNARTLAFSPDSGLLAFSTDQGVSLWRTGSWEQDRTLPGTRLAAVFSPDGQWLVTGAVAPEDDAPGGYRVWNTKTWQPGKLFGSELVRIWVASRAVAFSGDGTLLVTAGHPEGANSRHQFQVWDFPTLTARTNFETFPGLLASATFAPDSQYLLTGTDGGALLKWSVAEGRIVERREEHTGWLSAITCARDGQSFATASSDQTLVLWDAATLNVQVRLRGHRSSVASAAISPDGRMLVSGARDATTRLWDPSTRHEHRELPECLLVAGFSSDSRRLVGVGYGESRLWNLERGTITNVPLEGFNKMRDRKYYHFMHASEDVHGAEPQAVFGRPNGVLEVWDLASMSPLTSWQADNNDVTAAAFSPDGQFIATSGAYGDVTLWETGTSRAVRRFEALGGHLMCLKFSPDGHLLAGSECREWKDSLVGLWDVQTGALRHKIPIPGHGVLSLAFSADGERLATAEQNETVRLWDVRSGSRPTSTTLLGHVQPVVGVAFSPDGKTLATAAANGKVKLWSLVTAQEVATLQLPGGCRSVRFSPDGRFLAVGYFLQHDEFIRLWEVPSFEDIAAAEATGKARITQP